MHCKYRNWFGKRNTESFYLFRPNILTLRFSIMQCINAASKTLIALIGLVNTNAMTLSLSRFLTWPNFELM